RRSESHGTSLSRAIGRPSPDRAGYRLDSTLTSCPATAPRAARGFAESRAAPYPRAVPLIQIGQGVERKARSVTCMVGSVPVGGGHPVVVQSMTNTDTEDAASTAAQTQLLAEAGSELVR